MGLIVLTPGTPSPVDLAEAKAHLRVDTSSEDTLIQSLIETVTEHLEGFHGRFLRKGTEVEESFDGGFPCDGIIKLTGSPIEEITSVNYVDSDGESQELEPETIWENDPLGSFKVRVFPTYGETWPTARYQPRAVWVNYTCGYDTDNCPAYIKHAILLLVGHFYRNRENEITGTITSRFDIAAYQLAGMNRANII